MIVVTGASGHLGHLVVNGLLEQGVPAGEIVAAARNTANAADLGVEVRHADYDDPASLKTALAGADKVLLISSNNGGQRYAHHKNVVDAAIAAGAGLLVFTSLLRADTSTLGLAAEARESEAYIRDSGIPYVFLRNGWYTENHTDNLAPALAHGTFLGSAKDGRIAGATRADYAAAAVAVLTDETKREQVYELAGDTAFTMAELAAEVSAQSGTPVTYTDLPQAEYHAALVAAGVPEAYADLLADSDVGVANGDLDAGPTDLAKLIGRPTTPLTEAVRVGLEG